jgi:NNP family nitrate/nitrite transporter-like MFS transporter
VVAGLLVDRLRPKRTGIIAQCIVLATLLAVWLFGIPSYSAVLILGVLLGVAGASFAVALPLASRWYPPQYQGIALGIAGAGNSGTVFAALFAPLLAARFGWTTVFGLAAIPVAIAFVTYLVLARDAPNPPAPRHLHQYADVLRDRDAWWFMLFYGVTFGGFSGLASSLTIYFNADYGLGPVPAGECTAACVFAGSMVRPLGGALADRIGGIRSLSVMYGVAAVALLIVSTHLRCSSWCRSVSRARSA